MQGVPFIGATAVESGSTCAAMSLSAAPLATVPCKRALAQVAIEASKILHY